jgi:hypothetical protein
LLIISQCFDLVTKLKLYQCTTCLRTILRLNYCGKSITDEKFKMGCQRIEFEQLVWNRGFQPIAKRSTLISKMPFVSKRFYIACMDNRIVEQYQHLLSERFNRQTLLSTGEDTIRYDFFCTILQVLKLNPWEIVLEHPVHSNTFTPRSNQRSMRKEKPQIDLVVRDPINLSIEFGLFRQNSNEEGSINKTQRTVKMIKDFIRLALDSYHTKRKGYFICVADRYMLSHQLRSRQLGPFPSNYIITMNLINQQMETIKCNYDDRFLIKLNELNFPINASLVYNQPLVGSKLISETRLLIWAVSFEMS